MCLRCLGSGQPYTCAAKCALPHTCFIADTQRTPLQPYLDVVKGVRKLNVQRAAAKSGAPKTPRRNAVHCRTPLQPYLDVAKGVRTLHVQKAAMYSHRLSRQQGMCAPSDTCCYLIWTWSKYACSVLRAAAKSHAPKTTHRSTAIHHCYTWTWSSTHAAC